MQADSDKLGHRQDAATIQWAMSCGELFCAIRFVSFKAILVSWGLWPPSHLKIFQHMVWCWLVIGPTMLETIFCAHRFFLYIMTVSDGSEGSTAGRVVSPRSIMEHQRSKEVTCARKQNIDNATWHSSQLVAAKLMYPAKSANRFSWLNRPTSIFVVEER